MVESQSEKEILNGCISLMEELVGNFEEWYKWQHGDDALDEIPEDERFGYNKTYFHIVQKLFLMNTRHGGGTSTQEKCKELGVEPFDEITFEFEVEE